MTRFHPNRRSDHHRVWGSTVSAIGRGPALPERQSQRTCIFLHDCAILHICGNHQSSYIGTPFGVSPPASAMLLRRKAPIETRSACTCGTVHRHPQLSVAWSSGYATMQRCAATTPNAWRVR